MEKLMLIVQGQKDTLKKREVSFVAEVIAEHVLNTTTSEIDQSMCNIHGKTDEPIYNLLNKTDEQMAIMPRRISDPLLMVVGDNDNDDSDCDKEFRKRGSQDNNSDDCCKHHKDRHRPDYVHVIPADYTQDINEICADRSLQEECKYQKTFQKICTQKGASPEAITIESATPTLKVVIRTQ